MVIGQLAVGTPVLQPLMAQPAFAWHCCTVGDTSKRQLLKSPLQFTASAWQPGDESLHLAQSWTVMVSAPGARLHDGLWLIAVAGLELHVSVPQPARRTSAGTTATASRRFIMGSWERGRDRDGRAGRTFKARARSCRSAWPLPAASAPHPCERQHPIET